MRPRYAAAGACLVAVVAAIAVGLLVHHGSASGRSAPNNAPSSIPVSPSGAAPLSALDAEFPATVHAVRMPPTYDRLPVAHGDLDNLVRVHGNVIVALANQGAFFGQVYAVISTDDGGGWRIDSPQFARARACDGCATDHLNVSRDGTVFAWGNDGSFVKVTTDLGNHWYQADFPDGIVSVSPAGRNLVARVMGHHNTAGRVDTRRYVSTDNGLTWQRRNALPTVKN